MKPILLPLMAAFAFSTFILSTNSAPVPSSPVTVVTPIDSSSRAPAFELIDVNGKAVRLSDYLGSVVVLNFFATWCPPCRWEIPAFNDLQKQYGQQGVQFPGIAYDEQGAQKVKPWLTTHTVSYPVLLPDSLRNVIASYKIDESLPVTYVIDRKGMLRFSFIGDSTKVDHGLVRFSERLKPLIDEH